MSKPNGAALDIKIFETDERSTWCPGCGDFGILNSIKRALADAGIHPHEVIFTSGIGCGSKLPHYLFANEFNSLHGRAIPVATGIKLAAGSKFTVISVTGDGDGYGIGLGHLIHAIRRNVDIVHVVENNHVYALTKGQYSPTSEKGWLTSTSPEGSIEAEINPLGLALMAGCGFVARGFSGDPRGLARIIARAIDHKGYALVDVLQDCVIYNRINSTKWYRERVYDLEEAGHKPTDMRAALDKTLEWGDRIPIGVFYESADRPTYEEQVPAIAKFGALVDRDIKTEISAASYAKMLDQFA